MREAGRLIFNSLKDIRIDKNRPYIEMWEVTVECRTEKDQMKFSCSKESS